MVTQQKRKAITVKNNFKSRVKNANEETSTLVKGFGKKKNSRANKCRRIPTVFILFYFLKE